MTVLIDAVAQRVILEPTDSGQVKAKGVLVTVHGFIHHVATCGEVTLAAGAFQSPKILELFGPTIPECNFQTNIYAMVERAADIIQSAC